MIEFSCGKCGQKLKVEEEHSGKQVKCPKCGGVGESDASIPPRTDEEPYQEETEEYEESEGRDRQLIVVISGVAAVVVVGLIVLAAVLRPSGSRPAEEPDGLPGQQQVADTDLRALPATSGTQATEPIVQGPQQVEEVPGHPETSVDDYESRRARAERAHRQKRKYERRQEAFKKWAGGLVCGLFGTFLAIMFVRSLVTGNWDFWAGRDTGYLRDEYVK